MGVEAVLFGIIGIVAIACAALMLISENAVHSALYLIMNFICVAFFYIMLEAPFLALIQIAVYAGAIMVLFLFVIMLLGAERTPTTSSIRRFPWLAPLALGLSLVFILATGVAIIQGQVDSQSAPADQALFRVINAAVPAADVPEDDVIQAALAERNFDVFLNGEVVAEGIGAAETTAYQRLAPGEYTLMFSPLGTAIESASTTLTLEAGQTVTAVVASDADGELFVDTLLDDLSSVERRSGRVTVYNAYTEPVSLVTVESELFSDSRTVNPVVMDVPVGEASESVILPEGRQNWTVIRAGTEQVVRDTFDPQYILSRTGDLTVERDTAQLLIVSALRQADGTVAPTVLQGGELVSAATAAFGSPEAVGEVLFIDYLLPFQLVAVLLLAAMVGVIVLTVREEHTPKPSRALRRKVNRPLTSVIAAQTGSDLSQSPRLPAATPQTDEQPEPAGD